MGRNIPNLGNILECFEICLSCFLRMIKTMYENVLVQYPACSLPMDSPPSTSPRRRGPELSLTFCWISENEDKHNIYIYVYKIYSNTFSPLSFPCEKGEIRPFLGRLFVLACIRRHGSSTGCKKMSLTHTTPNNSTITSKNVEKQIGHRKGPVQI